MIVDGTALPERFTAGVPVETGFGEQVVLRRLGTGDAEAFAAHVAADLERLRTYLPWPDPTSTAEGARAWLGRYEAQQEGRVVVLGIWAGTRLLGGVLLFEHDREAATIEIGIWVVAAAEGCGVASAACRELIAFARRELGVERVEWRAASENVASVRLAGRLGFRHEGTLRSVYVLRGRRLDLEILSLVGGELDGL